MAYTTPKTWTAASTLTAAELNEQIRDNITDLDTRLGDGRVGRMIPLMTTADVSKSGATYTDITGLTFAVENGKFYVIPLLIAYTVGGTSTGLTVGFSHPGGSCRAYVEIHGVASAATHTDEVLTAVDSGTGTSSANAAPSTYFIEWVARYECTVNGTFALRYARNGTSTTVTILAGSGGLVLASA